MRTGHLNVDANFEALLLGIIILERALLNAVMIKKVPT